MYFVFFFITIRALANLVRSQPTDNPLVTLELYKDAECPNRAAPDSTLAIYEQKKCFAFPSDTHALVVAGIDKTKMRYNSLRLHSGPDCNGGWTLEPIYYEGGRRCSTIGSYGSVEVVLRY